MISVALCLCTCQRPQFLEDCFRSLQELKLPEKTTVQLIVVDNDEAGSAQPVVDQWAPLLPFPVTCVIEPKRGIPCARNRAIRETKRIGADYLVFFDDDEQVTADWLNQLLGYCLDKGGAAVISGFVHQQLPADTHQAIMAQFQKKIMQTGDRLTSCATDNVLIPMSVIEAHDLWFDEQYPLAGGTDTIFFTSLHKRGVEIYKCMEAELVESIPAERATVAWLSKRKFRVGVTDAWRKQQRGRTRFSIVVSAVLQIPLNGIRAALLLLVGKFERSLHWWLRTCRAVGVAAGVLGFQVNSY